MKTEAGGRGVPVCGLVRKSVIYAFPKCWNHVRYFSKNFTPLDKNETLSKVCLGEAETRPYLEQ